jgi:hypothetical protein
MTEMIRFPWSTLYTPKPGGALFCPVTSWKKTRDIHSFRMRYEVRSFGSVIDKLTPSFQLANELDDDSATTTAEFAFGGTEATADGIYFPAEWTTPGEDSVPTIGDFVMIRFGFRMELGVGEALSTCRVAGFVEARDC